MDSESSDEKRDTDKLLLDSEDEDVAFFDREDTNTSTIKNDNNNSSFAFTNKKKHSSKISVKSNTQMDIQDGLKDISSHSKKKRKVGKQVIGKGSSKRVHNTKCRNEFKRLFGCTESVPSTS